jgi:anti-anti-sigma factor
VQISAIDASSALSVSVDRHGGLVLLSGELDRDSAHHLLEALDALSGSSHPVLRVDAAEVTFCDAGGLRALVAGSRLVRSGGRDLRIVRAGRCVERLLVLAGLEGLLDTDVPPGAAIDLTARRGTRPRVVRTIRLDRSTATA